MFTHQSTSLPNVPKASSHQRGYSLIELSLALAILSVIIVGSLLGVQRILANNRANQMLETIPKINAAIIGMTANAGKLDTLTTATAIQLGAFPAGVNAAGTAVSNEFGGEYYVAGIAQGGGQGAAAPAIFGQATSKGYMLYATNIPQTMCATVANGLSPLAQGVWVVANITAAPAAGVSAPALGNVKAANDNGGNIDLAKLGTACGGAAGVRTIQAFITS